MTTGLCLAFLAIAFACCIISYGQIAKERGWPFGIIHTTNKPVFIGLAIIAGAIARIVYAINHKNVDWRVLALTLVAWFVIAPIIVNTFKASTAIISLLGAPITLIASFFIL